MKYDHVSERTGPDVVVRNPQDLLPLLSRFAKKRKEHFLVVTLSGNHVVQRLTIVSIGIANRTLVHPREVFQPAIKDTAVAIIVAHNHPSGNCEPSSDDIEVTRRLVQAGEILGIPVLDHIIFSGQNRYVSLQEQGSMPDGKQRSY